MRSYLGSCSGSLAVNASIPLLLPYCCCGVAACLEQANPLKLCPSCAEEQPFCLAAGLMPKLMAAVTRNLSSLSKGKDFGLLPLPRQRAPEIVQVWAAPRLQLEWKEARNSKSLDKVARAALFGAKPTKDSYESEALNGCERMEPSAWHPKDLKGHTHTHTHVLRVMPSSPSCTWPQQIGPSRFSFME